MLGKKWSEKGISLIFNHDPQYNLDSMKFCGLVVVCLLTTITWAATIDENDGNSIEETVRNVPCGDKINEQDFEDTLESCLPEVEKRRALEEKLSKLGRVIDDSKPTTDQSLIRRRITDPHVHLCEMGQLVLEAATNSFMNNFGLTEEETRSLADRELDGQYSKQARDKCNMCYGEPSCDETSMYRTISGTCNNLQNPLWGSAMSCQQRLLYPSYVGTSGFRVSYNGNPLPEPRQLSLNIHSHLNRPTNFVTHMYTFFGQLLDHDIALTPQSTTIDNQAIQCCPESEDSHPQCAPIRINTNDPFYSRFNVNCLNFVRSAMCPTCQLGYREQMDQVTSFIDASFVYGNTLNETMGLRRNDGTGRLRVTESAYGDLLPPSPNPENDQCSFPETNDICFLTGDPRANQHNTLTSLHTIFVREHNRLASELRMVNPNWDEERLFQEARRIVGAEMQVITYKEYLPITIGNDRMTYFNLWLSNRGSTYNPRLNPSMISEFSTAAFRFGHSLIRDIVADNPLNGTNQQRFLRNEFFAPFELRTGLISPLLSGTSYSPAQWFDRNLVPDVTNYLYRIRNEATGLDLASFNIQRGRDHGMPPYVEAVRYCSTGEIILRNFDDLTRHRVMSYANAQLLRTNYAHVQDIDLWTGILSETYNDGAVVGPTGICIIGMMFNRLKYGDRFYFEHRNQQGSFTYQQLQELRKVSLARIICSNTDIARMPLNAMLFTSKNNPTIYCSRVKGVDLSYWRDYTEKK
ncbi:peroxidase-like [Uloborus diversus]|uniref:peroxidase-like n=1 Tax=Uloborus diversus TaxID=327109 RepID=UPI002409147C|nr:peroxidase-like [Uloborus diversus]